MASAAPPGGGSALSQLRSIRQYLMDAAVRPELSIVCEKLDSTRVAEALWTEPHAASAYICLVGVYKALLRPRARVSGPGRRIEAERREAATQPISSESILPLGRGGDHDEALLGKLLVPDNARRGEQPQQHVTELATHRGKGSPNRAGDVTLASVRGLQSVPRLRLNDTNIMHVHEVNSTARTRSSRRCAPWASLVA